MTLSLWKGFNTTYCHSQCDWQSAHQKCDIMLNYWMLDLDLHAKLKHGIFIYLLAFWNILFKHEVSKPLFFRRPVENRQFEGYRINVWEVTADPQYPKQNVENYCKWPAIGASAGIIYNLEPGCDLHINGYQHTFLRQAIRGRYLCPWSRRVFLMVIVSHMFPSHTHAVFLSHERALRRVRMLKRRSNDRYRCCLQLLLKSSYL